MGLFSHEDFLKDDILACVELGINYRVIIALRILVSFRGFFEDYIFCTVKYLNFHNSFFCLKILFNVNGKATS